MMNHHLCDDSSEPTLNDILLDRLVDGELSADEYRRVLASLEEEPGGWRRCAAAFLEAQAWSSDLTAPVVPSEGVPSEGVQSEVDQTDSSPLVQPTSHWPSSPLGNSWSLWLSVAACLLLAFGLGVLSGRGGKPMLSDQPAPQLVQDADAPSDDHRPSLVHKPVIQPSGSMTLLVGGGDQAEEIELPVFDAEQFDAGQIDAHWFERPALPDDVVQALQRAGHRLRRHQQLWPVEIQDGRRVIVPVEQIEVVPVRGRAYQ